MEDRIKYYARIADKYITDDIFLKRYHENRFNTFNSLLPNKRNLKIFDFGCGSGENVINLLKMGYQVNGCDISKEMVKLAKNNLRKSGFDDSIVYCVGGWAC